MKVLLVQPNSSQRMVGFTSLVRPEPLALEILAANLPDHEVKILDLRVDPTLGGTMASFQPDIVGITGYTTDVAHMRQICNEVKLLSPEATMVVGGYHASLCPHDFDLESVDIIVVGEGEVTFRELVQALERKRELDDIDGITFRRNGHLVSTRPRTFLPNLDNLPLPARHLTDHYRQHYHFHFWDNPYLLETARGCPYRCTFCAVWKFHRGKCRFRDPDRVLEDLKTVASDVVCFVDDNFLQSFRRAERLHELIKEAGLKARYWIQARSDSIVKRPDLIRRWAEIGLTSALIGFEKFRQEELNGVNKNNTVRTNERAMEIMHKHGVDIWGAFIIDPQWTRPDFDDLIDYVRRMKIVFPQFTVLTPLPGTAFFQEKFHELITHNYEVFDFLHTVLPTRLPLEEFYDNMARLYANTTLGWNELKKRIKSGRIPLSSLKRMRDLLRDVTSPEAYLRDLPVPQLKP